MARQIKYGDEARAKILSGADQLANAVVTTLGPKGRNVALDKKWGAPHVIHDGVTVARDIELEDPFENMGAQLIKEAASKTNDNAGDGTTTATLLAVSILREGHRMVGYGASPMTLKKGIDQAVTTIVDEIKRISKPVKTKEETIQVATIAAASSEIGNLIAEALEKIGKQGVISVEEGSMDTTVEYKMGMEFDKGYASPYFATNQDKMEAEIKDCLVIITDEKISATTQIIPLLENSVQKLQNKNLLIIADEIEGDALATLVVNKMRGVIKVIAVAAPAFADRKKAILEDIATLTGATVITKEAGLKLENVSQEQIGRADTVWADAENTRIIGGKGDPDKMKARIALIKGQITNTTSDFEKEKLQERLAKLVGGVAVIKTGAPTEQEMKEKKERVNDAVGATKSALEEGIVPGGGVTLLRARKVLLPLMNQATDDQKAGIEIVYRSLATPIRKIIENAGLEAAIILRDIEDSKIEDYGFDVETETYGALIEKGIVDPAKVTRSAIQNGASVASVILTTEALITDIPEKKDEQPQMPMQ